MKRRWLAVPLVVGVLAIGLTAGTIVAQEAPANGDAPEKKSFAARVAAILGLGEDVVEDAFKQAKAEIQDERLRRKLDSAVDKGLITQEQADDYYEWYQLRPDFPAPGFGFQGHRGPKHRWHGRFSGPRLHGSKPAPGARLLPPEIRLGPSGEIQGRLESYGWLRIRPRVVLPEQPEVSGSTL